MKIKAERKAESFFLFTKGKRKLAAAFIILFIGFGFFPGLVAGDDQKLTLAPLNKAFVEYRSQPSKVLRYTAEGHPLGLIPGPIDFSYLKEKSIQKPKVLKTYPPSYDLRTVNKLTSVKNQGSCGSCWAFATYGSLESFLMPAEPHDFSEQHLIDNHGFDYGPCDGGQINMSMAYLTRWGGPVNETDDPYVLGNGYPVAKHVQEVMLIPGRSSASDNNNIKDAIMNYGAVYTSMSWVDSAYNSTYKTYYNSGISGGGHAVAIVGWDDNFDAAKFNTAPAGNGAFIVKNSWGPSWGENGYFYVSYYDYFLGNESNAVVKAENATKYLVNYQYDPLGWMTGLSYGSDTAWMANVYQAQSNLPLQAVGFYTASTVNNYEIYIYLNTAPRVAIAGDPVATKSGVINSPGFFTIELDNPVALTAGQYFSVVVRLQTVGYEYPIPIEGYIGGYSSGATTNPGMCLVSSNGTGWTVLTDVGLNYDICLKAFAGLTPIYPPINLRLASLENNFIFFKEKINRLTWAANPANGTNIVSHKIYRKASNESTFSLLATVSGTQYTFDDRGLKNPGNYSYQVTVVDEYERESDPVTVSGSAETPAKVLKTKSYRTKVAPKNLVDSK